MTLRLVPPTGTPLKLKDLFKSINAMMRGDSEGGFKRELKSYLGASHCFFVSSGRAALTIILKSLYQISGKEEVIVPAYTCFTVPAAVVRAKLKVRLNDIEISTFDLDYRQLKSQNLKNVLAVVVTSLFGLPVDMDKLSEFAQKNGLFLIDDSAQSLGASWGGKKAGTFGDVGFYSLSKGKNITTIEGGIIVTNDNNIAQRIDLLVSTLRKPNELENLTFFVKSLIYTVFLNPHFYRLPSKLPFLKLGISEFNPDFQISSFTSWQASLGKQLFRRLGELNQKRRENANQLADELRGCDGLIVPQISFRCEPAFLRLPILVKDLAVRERIYQGLLKEGIGVSKMYPLALDQISSLLPHLAGGTNRFPKARFVASHILTLPTHPHLKNGDKERIISLIKKRLKSHERIAS
ncbi:MAG: DegT/DnrJ/EryC1/StrS family aminotransferase [Candidatus Zixiibacteriota bacterium]